MAVTITFNANPEPDIDHYNVYRATASPLGPYTQLGTVPHVPATVLTYSDPTGEITHYYKLSTVNLSSIESLATNAFQPMTNANLNRLYDVILNASQQPVVGIRVEARLDVPQAKFNGVVVPRDVSALTDSNGFWYLDLYPNSVLEPVDSQYIITIQNVNPPKRVTVPPGTIVQYSTLISLP